MSNKELEDKVAFYKDQELLDISDDETGFPDAAVVAVDRALADSKKMAPPAPLLRQKTYSFLGSTPKAQQAEYAARRQRAAAQDTTPNLIRAATAPEVEVARSFPSVKAGGKRPMEQSTGDRKKLKRNASSLSDLRTVTDDPSGTPFYKRFGVVPRELKGGKKVKLADDIRLEPEHKQLLKGKIVYFYPNNDISSARRQRIHKVIQLGAAWVTKWRDDVTHVIVDEASTPYTYSQVLRNVNMAGLPRKVVLVKFEPYIPQCIQFGTLLDPTASRFQVAAAPKPIPLESSSSVPEPLVPTTAPEAAGSNSSQTSLQIKKSRRELEAESSQRTESISVADSFPPTAPPSKVPADTAVERVEDSFISSPPAAKPMAGASQHNDALAEAIEQIKAVAHLPLDDEDEPALSRTSTTEEEVLASDTEEERSQPPPKKAKKSAKPASSGGSESKGFNQLAYQCMDPRATNAKAAANPNARTIQILEEMGRYYDQMQDTWRTLAYRRAVGVLRKQPVKICTKEQAEALPFIGGKLAEKIEEIILTDRLRKLDNTREDPTDKILRLFLGIYGVGVGQAHRWIQAGHRTLDDLKEKVKLTDNQKVGIEHYEDFAKRIPRADVEAHGAYVRNALQKLDPDFEVIIGGSYRRGAKDSGDIDLIITKPGALLSTLQTVIFDRLIPKLFGTGFLKVSLATSHRYGGEGTKWHGASCLPSSTVWRRLDMLLVPEEEMGAALIYFTGNDIFNRSIRLLASKKGMRLNQKGLYKDVARGKNREKLTEGTLVEGRSEKRIFEILGVPWRSPTERIC